MKYNPDQLSLFHKRGLPATAQPFQLQPSPEEIVICVVCGREEFYKRRTAGGLVVTRVGEHSACHEKE